jgi:tetratricopeptide (TPR) repeat protein
MESIKLLGKPTNEEDKQAVIEANAGKIPDLILLKSRLLFDGGQSNIAIKELLKLDLRNRDNIFLSEHAYRLGRCYHWLGNENEALKWYEISIQKGALLNEYFAASASYQTGKILTQQKRFIEGKAAYLRVSQFPEHPYKSSIDAKAKTAMKQLNSN